jgi:hypothetical protein
MTPQPTDEQIRAVMSYLGKRNKGKPKQLTVLGYAQRIRAGRISGRLRSERARARRGGARPEVGQSKPPKANLPENESRQSGGANLADSAEGKPPGI